MEFDPNRNSCHESIILIVGSRTYSQYWHGFNRLYELINNANKSLMQIPQSCRSVTSFSSFCNKVIKLRIAIYREISSSPPARRYSAINSSPLSGNLILWSIMRPNSMIDTGTSSTINSGGRNWIFDKHWLHMSRTLDWSLKRQIRRS